MWHTGPPALTAAAAQLQQRAPPAKAKLVIKGGPPWRGETKRHTAALKLIYGALSNPTTRGYGNDMDVLFMIMYGGDSYADSQQSLTFFLCL